MDAFDADVLIYAANEEHPLGRRVRPLIPVGLPAGPDGSAGVGSMLLIPELMIKPSRQDASPEAEALAEMLVRLHLLPVDEPTSRLATQFGAVHGLKTVDAVHLATAVLAGADRFITNNSRDFPKTISEIAITYPADLPEPAS